MFIFSTPCAAAVAANTSDTARQVERMFPPGCRSARRFEVIAFIDVCVDVGERLLWPAELATQLEHGLHCGGVELGALLEALAALHKHFPGFHRGGLAR